MFPPKLGTDWICVLVKTVVGKGNQFFQCVIQFLVFPKSTTELIFVLVKEGWFELICVSAHEYLIFSCLLFWNRENMTGKKCHGSPSTRSSNRAVPKGKKDQSSPGTSPLNSIRVKLSDVVVLNGKFPVVRLERLRVDLGKQKLRIDNEQLMQSVMRRDTKVGFS